MEEIELLAVCTVLFLLCIAITRAIFSIPKFLKYQKAQTMTLLKIAEQQGVSDDIINSIILQIEPKGDNNVVGEEKRFKYQYNRL